MKKILMAARMEGVLERKHCVCFTSSGHRLCVVEGYWARHLFKPRLTVLGFSYNVIANNFDQKIYFPFRHLFSKEGGE